ncbi:MAG TPA: hypothetical protein VFK48_11830 [Usitatibacter sp.]|nr:hypothetical protein [Usitatibacter sp.]
MRTPTATDRSNARGRRLAQVKFVALPAEHTPPADTARSRLAARLRDFLNRAIGCLEAARP